MLQLSRYIDGEMGEQRQSRFLSFNTYFKRNLLKSSDINTFICGAGYKLCHFRS